MKKLISENKIILAVFAVVILLAINGKTLFSVLNTDFIGIVVSCSLFVIGGRKTNYKINYFLFVSILILEFVTYRLHTKSVHFLAMLMLLFLVFHYFTAKFSFIAFICIILFSTLFSSFFTHLTAEIKQGICYVVYLTMKNFITIDKIEGVNFFINNSKITIDTACMGLSMFKTGLLSGAILMTLEERKQKQYYGIFQILQFCFLIIVLNVVSNYFRIITLVIFNCTQENTLHHGIGLICFTVYQIIPMLLLVKYIKPKLVSNDSINIQPKTSIIILSFVILFAVSIKIINENNNGFRQDLNSKFGSVKGVWVNDEVFKMEDNKKLTYIKTPSHNPLVCWTGNGYTIIESKKIFINNEEIWFNKMEKNGQNYKSYWWYQCGDKKYTSMVEVMFIKLIYNQPVFLINETTK
ncbi:MAG: exosortase N [Flavobacterium sp.]|nr:MAG: exosortase N [Flavobacterium sp.]